LGELDASRITYETACKRCFREKAELDFTTNI
jgi:pimeloyl-ACP methyl ester carboxylesterase